MAFITKTSHLLDFNINVQLDFLEWIYRGCIEIYPFNSYDLKRIIN